jgi:hypothetical protein
MANILLNLELPRGCTAYYKDLLDFDKFMLCSQWPSDENEPSEVEEFYGTYLLLVVSPYFVSLVKPRVNALSQATHGN